MGKSRGALPPIKKESTEHGTASYGILKGPHDHHCGCHGRPCGGSVRWNTFGQSSHVSGFEIKKIFICQTRGACVDTKIWPIQFNGPGSVESRKELPKGEVVSFVSLGHEALYRRKFMFR